MVASSSVTTVMGAIGFACRPHSALLSSSCFVIVGPPSPVPTRNSGFLIPWKN